MKIKFIMYVFALFFSVSCTTTSNLDTTQRAYTTSYRSGDGSAHVSPEDRKKFVDGFLRPYTLIVGQSFLVHENVLLAITPGSSFQTKNLGSIEQPDLTFELNIKNVSTPNHVVSLTTDETVLEKFEITGATTADFFMIITTESGQEIRKEMEIEISGDSILLDKVDIAKAVEVPVTMESFNARGLFAGHGSKATSAVVNTENGQLHYSYNNREGKPSGSYTLNWLPRYSWQQTPVIVQENLLSYRVGLGGFTVRMRLKNPLDNTKRILKGNIETMEIISHTGSQFLYNYFY